MNIKTVAGSNIIHIAILTVTIIFLHPNPHAKVAAQLAWFKREVTNS